MAHGVEVRELTLPADALLALAEQRPLEYPVLLDSASPGPLGRWSILVARPEQSLLCHTDDVPTAGDGFLERLEHWWQRERQPAVDAWPFAGGWLVYLGYELAAQIESGLRLPAAESRQLLAAALRVRAALLRDHLQQRTFAIAEPGETALLQQVVADARAAEPLQPLARAAPLSLLEDEPGQFRDAVLQAQQYIRNGDIYQANLSRAWRAPDVGSLDGAALYRALRRANPAPFAAWARLPGLELCSSSPERLLRVKQGRVESRPIAGTRPRSGDAQADALQLAALLASPKERAEHVMLIDLERNDLGRVCEPGSVRVDEFMTTESYQHVHHIVSNVRGDLRADASPVAALRAVFPGGTITGCPKYRCMQLIGELEGRARGAYTGALGYLGRDGSMDFNILIRTLVRANGVLELRAGAGIVADSDWRHELQETRHKARGVLRALGAD